ncbi:uncharacterized protein LOC111381756 isoform X3 [Olea europaea var. sylvestris]|uniref:uncharacterized protein LOC111381756 isoform X3 n=1 Tax=Olea europaea var. sylvestris TaxID=158386 RepID=UPI000C1CE809|nr:uncharacterized protein LOC111381756 isoform X3 [Olea europaea var. sylvestris]
MEMTSDVKSSGEELVGSRVKVWWPKDNKFCDGVAASYGLSGKKNLENTCTSAHAPSSMIPELATDVKDHGEELIGCKVKVWWPKDKRCREGVVASYDHSGKKHLVVYTNGVGEMLDLRKEHRGTVNQKTGTPAHASAYVTGDDDMESHWHVRKKLKGQPLELVVPSTRSEDEKEKKLENNMQGDNELVNFKGYKVKANNISVLEAVFSKYGDIAANCLYKSTTVRASLLDIVSDVVKRLQYYDVEDILTELKVLDDEVSDLEATKIDVAWLHQHLAKVHEFAACYDKTLLLKEAKANSRLVLGASKKEMLKRRAELVAAQERFKDAEKRVNAMKLVGERIEDDVQKATAKEDFSRKQLEGLL